MQQWWLKQWQTTSIAHIILLPLSWLFAAMTALRRFLYRSNMLTSQRLSVPVVVVGNISVGGTGKTPLVIELAAQLQRAGFKPGIISRGYGGTQSGEVLPSSPPLQFGDEPVLIAKRSACPVWVNADRVAAGRALLAAHPSCNVIISDDGLQHYRLQRDMEIVVVNSTHSLGNHRLLPAGPLREKISRLSSVHAIVDTGRAGLNHVIALKSLPPVFAMQLNMLGIVSIDGTRKISLEQLKQQQVMAIAGIGHPERFFNFLKGLGLSCSVQAFADHHAFTKADFAHMQAYTLLMTEKDAVKCQQLNLTNAWYMPVSAMLAPEADGQSLASLVIQYITKHRGTI
ncbi:MAG TPA: tetraacyldisaccharide 4'-kinase [Methylophilus sp.]